MKKVLVIDDELDIRAVAQLALEDFAGWEVRLASSGKEGIAMATESRPDAILLDVMMPEMDGPATLKELRAQPATGDIPVVLLTAKVHEGHGGGLADLGADGVVAKPFDPFSLAGQISRSLGWEE